MKTKSVLLTLMLLGIVLVSGCNNQQPPPYSPKVDFTVSPSAIDINDNQTSNLIEVTITKKDTENKPTKFVLKFKQSNPDYMYVVDPESKEKVEQKETEILTEYGRNFQCQFKVFGKKMSGQDYSPWNIIVELYYNNTKIDERRLYVTVR